MASAGRGAYAAGASEDVMAEPALRSWTVAGFLSWQGGQPDLYELVGGRPRLMAGATNVHDDIVVNIVAELKNQTRGTGCRPFTGDGAVETLPGQIRRPDVGLDCGDRRPDAMLAADPRLVVEVLSPSTRDLGAFEKLDEYKAMPGVRHVLLVEPNQALAVLWRRSAGDSWESGKVEGLDASVEMPDVGVSLRMSAIYDGVAFPRAPRLVADDGTSPG